MPDPEHAAKQTPLWRNPSFTLMWTSTAASGYGDRMIMLAALAMLGGMAAGADVSAVQASTQFWFFLPYLLFNLVGGWLADHLPRKWMLLSCDEARGLILLASFFVLGGLSGAAPLPQESQWKVYTALALIGCFAAIFNPTRNAIVPQIVRPQPAPILQRHHPRHQRRRFHDRRRRRYTVHQERLDQFRSPRAIDGRVVLFDLGHLLRVHAAGGFTRVAHHNRSVDGQGLALCLVAQTCHEFDRRQRPGLGIRSRRVHRHPRRASHPLCPPRRPDDEAVRHHAPAAGDRHARGRSRPSSSSRPDANRPSS